MLLLLFEIVTNEIKLMKSANCLQIRQEKIRERLQSYLNKFRKLKFR